jgi:hypothetical protein
MSRKKWILLLALSTLLLLSGAVAASPQAQDTLARFVTAAGGGRSTSASFVVHGTIGQAASGELAGETRRLRSGFWVGPPYVGPGPTATLGPGTPGPLSTATATRTPGPNPGATSTRIPTNTAPPTSTGIVPGTATPTPPGGPASNVLLPWLER